MGIYIYIYPWIYICQKDCIGSNIHRSAVSRSLLFLRCHTVKWLTAPNAGKVVALEKHHRPTRHAKTCGGLPHPEMDLENQLHPEMGLVKQAVWAKACSKGPKWRKKTPPAFRIANDQAAETLCKANRWHRHSHWWQTSCCLQPTGGVGSGIKKEIPDLSPSYGHRHGFEPEMSPHAILTIIFLAQTHPGHERIEYQCHLPSGNQTSHRNMSHL